MADLEWRRIVELADCRADSIDDLAPAVTCVHAPETGSSIQDRAALRCEIMHALSPGEQHRRGLELPIGGERHPPGCKIDVPSPHGSVLPSQMSAVYTRAVRSGQRLW